ncbi:KR domain-containing protein [Streptacidiphilus sp. 4-A2]|nr:KR domain-containing protein [Streptacidiphilus sp. 4-A2]
MAGPAPGLAATRRGPAGRGPPLCPAGGQGLDYGPAFRGCAPPGASVTRSSPRSSCRSGCPGAGAASRCTPRCWTPPRRQPACGAAPSPVGDGVPLPFSWQQALIEPCAQPLLRVALRPDGPDAVSLRITDPAGNPVATVGSLLLREASTAALRTPADSLFLLDWMPLAEPPAARPVTRWGLLGPADGRLLPPGFPVDPLEVDSGRDPACPLPDAALLLCPPAAGPGPQPVHAVLSWVLERLRGWLADDRFAGVPLVVLTRGAAEPGGGPLDLAAAAVWGLLRAAQLAPGQVPAAGHRRAGDGRRRPADRARSRGATTGTARGVLKVPRLVRAGSAASSSPEAGLGPQGTVLLSGGGALAVVLARHLVAVHGVRRLRLLSRQGPDAAGMPELIAELAGAGAELTPFACDLTDGHDLAAALGRSRRSTRCGPWCTPRAYWTTDCWRH